jgi:hypothetical protein
MSARDNQREREREREKVEFKWKEGAFLEIIIIMKFIIM